MDTGTKDSSDSDHTAEKRAGKSIEDLEKAVTRRLKLTATRQMMTTLMRTGIGTNDVEFRAFQMVKDGADRGGRRLNRPSTEGDLGEIVSKKVLMKVNRNPTIVLKLMKIKFEEIRKNEKILIKEEKEAWKEFEVTCKEGSRGWRNVKNKIKVIGQKVWEIVRTE